MFDKKVKPPLIPRLLLRWLLSREEFFEFSDDIDEVYREMLNHDSKRQVVLWYWARVAESLPGIISDIFYRRIVMFKNYIKITFRNILQHKLYSFINISSLAVGFVCCFVILLYLANELNYDTFHKDSGSIYRLVRKMPDIHGPSTRNPMAPALKENFPEIEYGVRTWPLSDQFTFRIQDQNFRQEKILFADPDFVKTFTFNFIAGNSNRCLEDPLSLVLTQSAARKYFGREDPIGKTISFEGQFDLNVTGVIKDVPDNSVVYGIPARGY